MPVVEITISISQNEFIVILARPPSSVTVIPLNGIPTLHEAIPVKHTKYSNTFSEAVRY